MLSTLYQQFEIMFLNMRRSASTNLSIPLNIMMLFYGHVFVARFNHTIINYRYGKILPFQLPQTYS